MQVVSLLSDSTTRPSHPRQASVDEKTQEFLESKLAQRPDKSELIERNILKGLAPALVAAREQLQKSQLQDKLAGNIASRPPREELEQKGILKGASS
ncbi:hypothetical protein B0H14DRAFT_3517471 [Mycena olivaceomarginata]|nr:hypothetical protein B0H14DRAFT_3517471 [Mycena olivaceomarginata]